MMRSASSFTNLAFALLLAFLFLIDVSIAGCYILLTLILLLFLLHLLRGGKFPRLPFFCYFFAAYIFFTLLATVFSVDRAASIRDNKELLIFLLIPIYLWLLNSWKRVWLSLWTVLAAAVFSALVGIFTVLSSKGIVLSDRLKGFTSHWMTYAGLLMFPFIFFSVLLLLRRESKKQAVIISGGPGGHAGRHRLFADPQRLAGHRRRPGDLPRFFQTQVFPGPGAPAADPGAAGAAGGKKPRAVHRRPAGQLQPRPDLHGLFGVENIPGSPLDRRGQQQYRKGHRRQRDALPPSAGREDQSPPAQQFPADSGRKGDIRPGQFPAGLPVHHPAAAASC